MPGFWRWAYSPMVVMATPLSGFVKVLSIVFRQRIATAGRDQ